MASPVRFAVVGLGDIAQRAVLPAFEHAKKKAALTALVSGEPNIRYLTGFTGDNGLLLLSAGSVTLLTDPRYQIQASLEVRCKVRIAKGPLVKDALALIRRAGWKRIGYEPARMYCNTFEAIKAGLIRDAAFFDYIEAHAPQLKARDLGVMEQVVRRSAALHLAHIATGGDPFEQGSSRPLDYGHWAAHKLEQLTGYRMRHGEAVAIGIALDTTYAFLSGFLPERDWTRVIEVFRALGLAVCAPELGQHIDDEKHPANVLGGLADFREHLGGQLTIMLLKGIGQAFDVHDIQRDTMVRSISVLKGIEEGKTAGGAGFSRPDAAAHPSIGSPRSSP